VGCIDPFDHDDDRYASAECASLPGGCCVTKLDCDDEDPAVHPDPLECLPGASERCTTTCGTAGVRSCAAACTWNECMVTSDGCNGIDDDCDGETDEDAACAPGETVPCTTICGTTGTGACTSECLSPLGLDCTPPVEACNGLDDDCDGTTDDGFGCIRGATVACVTSCGSEGHGTCSIACTSPAEADCRPPRERCNNGSDDDCDGETDELEPWQCLPGETLACTTTCGSGGTAICPDTCIPPGPAECAPPAETCSGADDDCDGLTDEGFPCVAGAAVSCTATCGTTGSGHCSATCTAPTVAECVPPVETCGDGVDDDCDGETDELCGSNDTCSSPAPIVPGTRVTGTTAGAIDDYRGPCAGFGGLDVVHSFTLGEPSDVLLHTAGSSFDTAIYMSATCGASDRGCGDDFIGGGVGWSMMTVPGLAAGTYYVVVDGGSSAGAGDYALTMYASPPGAAGDRCGFPLYIPSTGGSVSTDLCYFTGDAEGSCGGAGPEAMYLFSMPVAGTVTFSTCNSDTHADTVLYVRSACDDAGTELGCNDQPAAGCFLTAGGSVLTVSLTAGAYFLFVDVASGACGTVRIDVSWA
jgi:hypothetical protein